MNWQEWFEDNRKYIYGADVDAWCKDAFEAGVAYGAEQARTYLAAPEQSKPYGYLKLSTGKFVNEVEGTGGVEAIKQAGYLPLYTEPPLRELSESDIIDISDSWLWAEYDRQQLIEFARAVLAAQKAKS
mgnify:CR=1 FL=1